MAEIILKMSVVGYSGLLAQGINYGWMVNNLM